MKQEALSELFEMLRGIIKSKVESKLSRLYTSPPQIPAEKSLSLTQPPTIGSD